MARISGVDLSDRQSKQKIAAEITDIIQAAITADQDAAVAIVKAAVEAAPFARDWIVAGAIAAASDQKTAILQAAAEAELLVMVRPTGLDADNISSRTNGTLNPVNFLNNENVTSPEKPPVGL